MKASDSSAQINAPKHKEDVRLNKLNCKKTESQDEMDPRCDKSKYVTFAGLLKLPKTLPNGIGCRVLKSLSDEFKVRNQIGHGTFATVWSVVRLRDKQPLAAKIVSS